MKKYTKEIEHLGSGEIDESLFKRKYVSAIVLTKDKQILLQMRDETSKTFSGYISTFGGSIEQGETPMQALIRELDEELGAKVNESDVISFGPITEKITGYTELLYTYFWHDAEGTITGCYEGHPRYFNSINDVHSDNKAMSYVTWLLDQCKHLI